MSTSQPIAVVLLSGGLDSMVVAGIARERGFAIHALTIDYGQRHARELASAREIAGHLGAARQVVLRLDLRQFGGSALTADLAVPKGGVGEDIPATYVPARNLVFLALTTAFAESAGARDIFIGVNALDYSGYPDCRPDFIDAFQQVIWKGTRSGVEHQEPRLVAPLLHMTKADIIRRGLELGVDYAITHSCYDPAPDGKACGHCDSCLLRRKGFEDARVPDPTAYADH